MDDAELKRGGEMFVGGNDVSLEDNDNSNCKRGSFLLVVVRILL